MTRKKGEYLPGPAQQDYLFEQMKSRVPAFPAEPINVKALQQGTMLDAERPIEETFHACRVAAEPYSVEVGKGVSQWRMSVHGPPDLRDRPEFELIELSTITNASKFNRKKYKPGDWVNVTGVLELRQELTIGGSEQIVRFINVTDIQRIKPPGRKSAARRR